MALCEPQLPISYIWPAPMLQTSSDHTHLALAGMRYHHYIITVNAAGLQS